jgi:hypothetical protein
MVKVASQLNPLPISILGHNFILSCLLGNTPFKLLTIRVAYIKELLRDLSIQALFTFATQITNNVVGLGL